jgi:LmbE family N-acetylglucosaminyl deacetylase
MNQLISRNSILSLIKKKPPTGLSFNQLIKAEKILILSPHPDDEIMGCGGTIYKYYSSGSMVHIVYVSDGRLGVAEGDTNLRRNEACAVKEIMPKVVQHFWDFEDSKLSENMEALHNYIKKLIDDIKPNIIFTPWILDHHDDHIAVTAALANALKSGNAETIISFYEIMSPVFGNHSVNISSEFETKKALLNKYKLQVHRYNIFNISTSLNIFRAALSRRKSVVAMECFLTVESNDFINIITSLMKGEK